VLAYSLGGLPHKNCQVQHYESKGIHRHNCESGKLQANRISHSYLLQARSKYYISCPRTWCLLGEVAVPEGVVAAAASKGHWKLIESNVAPRKKHDDTISKNPQIKLVYSGQLRGRP